MPHCDSGLWNDDGNMVGTNFMRNTNNKKDANNKNVKRNEDVETDKIIGNPSLLTVDTGYDGNGSGTDVEHGNETIELAFPWRK